MEKTPAALTLLIAATLMGCASTVKKTTDSDAKNELKQSCTPNTINQPIVVARDINSAFKQDATLLLKQVPRRSNQVYWMS